jgi:hypothetical protein
MSGAGQGGQENQDKAIEKRHFLFDIAGLLRYPFRVKGKGFQQAFAVKS